MYIKRLTKSLKRQYSNGAPQFRYHKAREALEIINRLRIRLQNSLLRQEEQYTRTREAWESRAINEYQRPEEIEHQVRDAMLLYLGAWILTVAELVTFWYLAGNLNVNPYFFLVLALVMTVALKAALIAVWNDPNQPLEAKRKLCVCVIWPALSLLLVSGAVMMLGRVANGGWAVALATWFSLALFALSISCVGLAAGLFGTAYLLMWSRRAIKKYCMTEDDLILVLREAVNIEEILREHDADGGGGHPSPSLHSIPLLPTASQMPRLVGAAIPIFLCLCMSLSACESTTSKRPPVEDPESGRKTYLHLINDWSLSTEDGSLKKFSQNFTKSLPSLAEKLKLTSVTVSWISSDGWNPVQITKIEFPSLQKPPKNETSELLKNISSETQREMLAEYQNQLMGIVTMVNPSSFVPPTGFPAAHCTDLNGAFKKIGSPRYDDNHHIYVVVTDGDESCGRSLNKVDRPSDNIVLVVVLLPQKEATGIPKLSYEQFEQRKKELITAIHWAVTIDPSENLLSVLEWAKNNSIKKNPFQQVAAVKTIKQK